MRKEYGMADLFGICPWWLSSILDNPIRRLVHDPESILSPYIERGQTVLDVGCGPGTFTIAIANLVGESGRVIAADVQDEMLRIVRDKAERAGLSSRIVTHKSRPETIGISEMVDFALAFYMVHEVPDTERFLREVTTLLKPNGRLLIVEPKYHVSASSFMRTVEAAKSAGLEPVSEPRIRLSRSMLFELAS